MFQFEERLEIQCSSDTAFSLLTSFEDMPRYVPEVRTVVQTSPGPLGAGTTFLQRLRYLGVPYDVPTLVTAWDPPVRFAYRSTRPPVYAAEYHLVPHGSATLLQASVTVTPTSWWRALEPIIRWRMPAIYRANLDRFKSLLEAGHH